MAGRKAGEAMPDIPGFYYDAQTDNYYKLPPPGSGKDHPMSAEKRQARQESTTPVKVEARAPRHPLGVGLLERRLGLVPFVPSCPAPWPPRFSRCPSSNRSLGDGERAMLGAAFALVQDVQPATILCYDRTTALLSARGTRHQKFGPLRRCLAHCFPPLNFRLYRCSRDWGEQLKLSEAQISTWLNVRPSQTSLPHLFRPHSISLSTPGAHPVSSARATPMPACTAYLAFLAPF